MSSEVPVFPGDGLLGPVSVTSVPTTVDAMALTAESADAVIEWIESIRGRGSAAKAETNEGGVWKLSGLFIPNSIPVERAEGVLVTGVSAMKVELGCWVIRGTKDEFYPCPIEVFAEKYRVEAKVSE